MDKLARLEDHFGSLKSEISHLSAEFKEDLEVENIKANLKEVEKSLPSSWDSINDLQADAKTHSDFKKTSQQTLVSPGGGGGGLSYERGGDARRLA